ncbi:MAG: NADAR family protein [Saprospiraceae bacterium]|nr:NADAR family protein [Saprospiraceae bacterium]
MILPGTTYKTTKDLRVKGTIHFDKPYSQGFEFDLPKGTDYIISYWTEPSDNIIQIWPIDSEKFKGKIVDKEILDSPFYDSYSFNINRIDVENNSTLIYDFSNAIYFYSAIDKYGEFSNFSPYGIDFDGLYYPTLEHYFQSQKFIDSKYSEKIRNVKTPKEASDLGKSRDYKIKDDWDEIKDDIMFTGLTRKFEIHQNLKDLLISTEDLLLIENSPFDNYWGIGKSGDGFNKLGILLMRIREIVKNAT